MLDSQLLSVIVGVVIGLVIGYLIARVVFAVRIRRLRQQSVAKSRQVMTGHITEQMAPLLSHFPYNFKDAMFLGKGVDYIVFEGLAQGDVQRITFLEIKGAQSGLNRNEQMIKKCIDRGAVTYQIWRK